MKLDEGIRLVLRVLAATFGVVGLLFLLFPHGTVALINTVGGWLGDFPPAPDSDLKFWLSLGFAYMVVVTLLAWLASKDPVRNRVLLLLLATGKGASSLTCLVFYLQDLPAFLYLLNGLVDGSLSLLALGLYAAAGLLEAEQKAQSGGPPVDFTSREKKILDAALDVLYPRGGAFPEGAGDLAVRERFIEHLRGFHPLAPRVAGLAMHLMNLGPYLWRFKGRSFLRLSQEDRTAYLSSLAHHRLYPIRLGLHWLKFLSGLQFYSHPEVESRLGYSRWFEKPASAK